MKQQTITLLIIMALFTTSLRANAAGQDTVKFDEVKAHAAEFQAKGKEVVVKLRPGTRILVGPGASAFEFTHVASLSGKVKEMRENDFVFSGTSSRTGEVIAVISYADVLNIKHPSGFEKAFRKVGKYSLMGVLVPAILPLYTIMALLGRLPDC
jgi:hypothetical protein